MKHTKEYAEELAKKEFPNDAIDFDEESDILHMRLGFVSGYMTALSENNVEELVEALSRLKSLLNGEGEYETFNDAAMAVYDIIDQALSKTERSES